jgi:hypothetical protein
MDIYVSDIKETNLCIIHPKKVGSFIFDTISKSNGNPQELKVLFLTSSGVFIRSDDQEIIIFISFGDFCNPFSITLGENKYRFSLLCKEDPVSLYPDCLVFRSIGISLVLRSKERWYPGLAATPLLPMMERQSQAKSMINHLLQIKGTIGFSCLAPLLINGTIPTQTIPNKFSEIIILARKYFLCGDIYKLITILDAFIGYGTGLTPSGDDFIIGALLTLNRWPMCTSLSLSQREILNQKLLTLFKTKTTNISTLLASYAVLGLADERLIAAVDTLMSGEPKKEKSASYLVDWGASSGLDTFLGMAFVGLQYLD